MFLMIGAVLLVLWLLGFLVFKKVLGGLIHIILIIALGHLRPASRLDVR